MIPGPLIGLANRHRGSIRLGGKSIDTLPTHRRVRLGLGYVPLEREIFPSLTVEENLAVATLPGGWAPARIFALFPALGADRRQGADARAERVAIGFDDAVELLARLFRRRIDRSTWPGNHAGGNCLTASRQLITR